MKIKEFSQKFDLTYDTIRYYMKLNLINPQKKGGHYSFDQEDLDDMDDIIKLKEMEFSLEEIKEILSFKRIGKLTHYQKNSYYQGLYKEKLKEINKRVEELKQSKKKLELHLEKIDNERLQKRKSLALSLDSLNVLACPECGGDLSLSAQKIKDNRIYQGSLNCSCGESIIIDEGIIYSGDLMSLSNDQSDESDIDSFFHVIDYIKKTNKEFMDKSYQTLEWLKKEIDFKNLTNKVILEPGSGYGLLLRHIYAELPENSTYICIDHNPKINIYLKNLLELSSPGAEIIFITAEMPDLPLKNNSVDYLFDFSGISNYSFHNSGFLPELMLKYFKENLKMIAVFIIYHKFGEKNIVDRENREYFIYQNIRNKVKEIGFKITEEYKSEIKKITASFGEYESFAQIGDQIYSYQLKAEK